MKWGWQKRVPLMVEEAKEILIENNFPTNSDELYDVDSPNLLISNAIKIVLSAEHLFKEIEKNRIGYALDRLFNICSSYEDMFILKEAKQFKNEFHTTDQLIHSLTSSHKGGVKGSNETKKQHSERIVKYQLVVNKISKENPSWNKTKVHKKAASILKINPKTLERNKINLPGI